MPWQCSNQGTQILGKLKVDVAREKKKKKKATLEISLYNFKLKKGSSRLHLLWCICVSSLRLGGEGVKVTCTVRSCAGAERRL